MDNTINPNQSVQTSLPNSSEPNLPFPPSDQPKKAISLPIIIASLIAFTIIILSLVSLISLLQQRQNNESSARSSTPAPTKSIKDAGQPATPEEISKGDTQVIEDKGLEPPSDTVKDATSFEGDKKSVLGIADAPIVTIDNPKSGPTLPRYTAVQIVASASHDSGIASIKIYINDSVIKTCGSNENVCIAWRTFSSGSDNAQYIIKAVAAAKSNLNNTGSASIEVCREGSTCGGVESTPNPTPTWTPTPIPQVNATYTPTPTNSSDNIAPTINFIRPTNGYLVTDSMSGVRVDASASDTSGIKKMEMYITNTNGRKLLASTTQSQIGYYILLRDLSIGTNTNTIEIRAIDRNDNTASQARYVNRSSITSTPTLIPRATETPTPKGSTTTPTPILTFTPTPTFLQSQYPIITGTADYISKIQQALTFMKSKSPTDYNLVIQNLREIREISSGNYAYVGSRMIMVSTSWANYSAAGAGGTIIHEMWHIKNYYDGKPWYGCEGEADSLRKQAAYLTLAGDSQLARYILDLIGHWPPGYDCSYCINTTCKP